MQPTLRAHAKAPTVTTSAWPRLFGAATTLRDAGRAGLAAALAAARGVQTGAHNASEAVQERAEAVADTAARAAHVPAEVAREVRREIDAWWKGVSRSAAIAAAMGVLGLFALAFLSIAAAVLLNGALGDPWGTLLIGAFYLFAVLLALVAMRRVQETAREEVAEHAEHAREALAGNEAH